MSTNNLNLPVQLPQSQSSLIAPSLRPFLTGGAAAPKTHPTKAPKTRKSPAKTGRAKKKSGR
jgi:hypothetical protein